MASRLQLHDLLKTMGTPNVYFQPPPSLQMVYPCIVYKVDNHDVKHADNKPYTLTKRYLVTVIDRNPDSEIPDKVAKLPMCRFSTAFQSADLNHQAFTLYF
ncbi:tail terminator [Arthrobacter phage Zeina]|nr:tail terminator [Arthrobacter phage Zeina]UVK58753.1 tail terminator [Arthrobacter phage GantcherGoblin]